MSPTEMKEARQSLGLSLAQMAPLLGYEGDTAKQQVRKMEAGERTIRSAQERLMRAYLDGYRPADWPA